jgi:hypothetical protein
LLVRSGLVSSAALEQVRAKVADDGGTIGEQLVSQGIVDDGQLTNFYKQRLLVPQVNPNTLARLPAKVVAVIPSEMAIELRAIPVSLDNDNNLTVAMSDPSDRHAVDEIAFFTGSYVVRAVATQMQIAWCLAHYYGHVTELGERLIQPDGADKPRPSDSQPAQRPRTRGITGEIVASRHKGIVPGEAFVDGTPDERANDERANDERANNEPAKNAVPAPAAEEPTKPRSKTASGEIRVPQPRAQSIKPPLPDDSGPVVVLEDVGGEIDTTTRDSGPTTRDSNPVLEMEADEGGAYEPVIEIGVGNESKPVPKRRRPADPDPPELAARAGEVQLATGQPIRKIEFDEPRIIIADELADEINPKPAPVPPPSMPTAKAPLEAAVEVSGELRVREHRDRAPTDDELSSIFVELGEEDSAPVMIHDQRVDESGPVLLDRRRQSSSDAPTSTVLTAAPLAEIRDELSEPIELPTKKLAERKKAITKIGIGAVTVATRAKLLDGGGGVPSEIDDAPTDSRPALDLDPTRIDTQAAPPSDDDMSDEALAAPPGPYEGSDTSPFVSPPGPSRATPPPSGHVKLDGVKPKRVDDEDDITSTHAPIDPAADDLDDGWGPPGTTIPPPLLGSIPGAITPASGIIPLPNIDSAPLIVAPPVPPERGVRAQTQTEAGLARALEEATARVLELIHTLDHTTERDQIIAVMIAHLAESHRRAGFFAMRGGALSLFAITPRIAEMSMAALSLDRPSTLADVVGTRLPYRGPMLDDTSRAFLSATLGACPPEILLVPIAVRERVVGVLFGDQRIKHTFDDQLALSARAAGMALERLLKTKRG